MSSQEIPRLIQALGTMYSNADANVKKDATSFLENFQKSQMAWEVTHQLLNDPEQSVEVKLFAAQTLRSKIAYDLHQLPEASLDDLKQSLIQLLLTYSNLSSDRLVRTQLCISLSQLALQHLRWSNAMDEILSKLSTSSDHIPCLLEFLKVLPEELNDVKKTSLTDEEFNTRTQQLITQHVEQVIMILSKLAASSESNSTYNSLILDCLNSWIKECPIEQILQVTTLTNLIFQSLSEDDSFDRAIECLCTIMRETRDIENHELIDALYQKVLELHQFMVSTNKFQDDPEVFAGLTRLYVEAGESWHVLIAKNPSHFKPLVNILLDCCRNDEDLDVVKYTFYFWYMLKQIITLPKFEANKQHFQDIYAQLIEVIIKHLTYPVSDSNDLFDGDKEQEDKFKDFRYEMGDVLKDCCAVVGANKALQIPFQQIQAFLQSSGSNKAHWQYLEAPLFSMRAMAKEVPLKEKQMLPTIMQFLVQLPEHPKVRYAATLVLGRYTEWTAKNPEFLEPQLNYIINGFQIASPSSTTFDKDIVVAATHALMFFCQDCSELLVNYLEQLYMLYGQVTNQLDVDSHYKLADGLAHVLQKLPRENMYKTSLMFFQPTLDKLKNLISSKGDEVEIADQIEVLTVFIAILRCKDFEQPDWPIATLFINEVWPLVPHLLNTYGQSLKVSERSLKLIKSSVQSFSTYLNPILGDVVNLMHAGFQQHKYGCYLWVSGVIVREFGDEYSSDEVKEEIYKFGLSQSMAFFDLVKSIDDITSVPDVVEDYFRMMNDLLMFYPFKLIPNQEMCKMAKEASLMVLSTMVEFEPLVAVLHFLIDFVSWGFEYPPVAFFEDNPAHIQTTVQQFWMIDNQGLQVMKVVIDGIIFKFHNDLQQDANDLLLKIMTVVPQPELAVQWLTEAISQLPNVNEREVSKLIKAVSVALPNKDNRRVRSALKDFANWYMRKNVKPRMEN